MKLDEQGVNSAVAAHKAIAAIDEVAAFNAGKCPPGLYEEIHEQCGLLTLQIEQQAAALERAADSRDIIALSVAGALERAGVTECDDPGEAIDVLVDGFKARIAELKDALRNLANECDNDYVAGWEERMTACIENANAVLGSIPAAPQPSEKLVNWGAVEGQAKAWLAVCTLIRELSPGCFLQPNKTSPEIVSEHIRDWHADACQYHVVMAEGLAPQRPAVPEGWVLVPLQPTQEMIDEAVDWSGQGISRHEAMGRFYVGWKRILAAAPLPADAGDK